jgi:hypothetical protein
VRVCEGDCNDVLAAGGQNEFPGGIERCGDLFDNDCDGHVDNEFDNPAIFDRDGDNFPNRNCTTACIFVPHTTIPDDCLSKHAIDCDDNDEDIFPGASSSIDPAFACDGKQNDCNLFNAHVAVSVSEQDQDGDGYFPCQGDCNDEPATGASIHPNAFDGCDGIDNDCDHLIDEDFVDADGDGAPATQCHGANGTAGTTADCDDHDASNSPLNTEQEFPGDDGFGDFKDNDCDGVADDGLPRLIGDIDVDIETERKRNYHSSSSSSSSSDSDSSSSSSSSSEPVTVTLTITIRNIGVPPFGANDNGDPTAHHVRVDGAIALPQGARIVTGVAEITGFRISADGDFQWTIDSIPISDDAHPAPHVAITIELADKKDIRGLRAVASIVAVANFQPHVVFTSI